MCKTCKIVVPLFGRKTTAHPLLSSISIRVDVCYLVVLFSLTNNWFCFHIWLSCFSKGSFSGDIIRFLSDIRLKHGQEAVRMPSCGQFVLANHLVNVTDVTHIDLSGITSLKGKYRLNGLQNI